MSEFTNTQFSHWAEAVNTLQQQGESFVLVTVLSVYGSAPRDAGTKMVIWREGIAATIGGGHLEYLAIQQAQHWLTDTTRGIAGGPKRGSWQRVEEYPLAARLGQCCGGKVTLLYEYFEGTAADIVLFGAGHVGKALVTILAQLPVRVRWIDSRAEEFPSEQARNITQVVSDLPHEEVFDVPPGAYCVVMTHNHTTDFDIVRALLARDDLAYVGVIGSKMKAKRFRHRLSQRGFSPEVVESMRCPVGLSAVPGKHPMEVAVSIAGEIIGLYQAALRTKVSSEQPQLKLAQLPQELPQELPHKPTQGGGHDRVR